LIADGFLFLITLPVPPHRHAAALRHWLLLGVAGCALSNAVDVHAQSAVAAGKGKAQACITCHGPLGLSQLPNAPHLAGQPEIYVAEQLKAYRSGKRSNEVMNVIARPLTDEDISQLAAWYASLVLEVRPPP
jgi:cytochrome c553